MSIEVGGDYYDCALLDDQSILFMVGDVAGHGVAAALVVAMAKAGSAVSQPKGYLRPKSFLSK